MAKLITKTKFHCIGKSFPLTNFNTPLGIVISPSAKGNRWGNGNKRKMKEVNPKYSRTSKNFIILTMINFVLIFIFAFFYLAQTNGIATSGYAIGEYEKQLSQVIDKNQKLKVQSAESQTMSRIRQETKNLDLISISDVSYLSSGASVVAAR